MSSQSKTVNPRYHLLAALSFILWGIFPVYFKILSNVSPWEIVGHRVIWSFLLLLFYLLFTRSLNRVRSIIADRRSFLLLGLAAILISSNWGLYVYTVIAGYVLEISLAYFISPLITIMLGIFFLREKTTPNKTAAVILCVTALSFKIIYEDSFSIYTILIAATFSSYSMVKKQIHQPSIPAFFIEVSYLLLPALGYFYYLSQENALSFTGEPSSLTFLLLGLGVVTSVPLLLFARSVKNVDLSIMGFIQYISPFMILILAVGYYQEEVSLSEMVVFPLIWVAVGLILYEGFRKRRKKAGR